MNRCRYRIRHWFTYYGWVGSSAPTCQRCGEPNPNYRPGDDPFYKPEEVLSDSNAG